MSSKARWESLALICLFPFFAVMVFIVVAFIFGVVWSVNSDSVFRNRKELITLLKTLAMTSVAVAGLVASAGFSLSLIWCEPAKATSRWRKKMVVLVLCAVVVIYFGAHPDGDSHSYRKIIWTLFGIIPSALSPLLYYRSLKNELLQRGKGVRATSEC